MTLLNQISSISEQQLKWNQKINIIESPHIDFKGAAISNFKPKHLVNVRTTSGCIGGSVLIEGWRRVNKGVICFDNRIFTHPNLNALNGLYVKVWYNQWLCLSLSIFQGPNLIEVLENGEPDYGKYAYQCSY